MSSDFKPGQYLLHRKGGLYKVLCKALHSETGQVFLVYVSMEGKPNPWANLDYPWARPYPMATDGRFRALSFWQFLWLRFFVTKGSRWQ